MVWFSEDVLSLDMVFENFLRRLRNISCEEGEEEIMTRLTTASSTTGEGKTQDVSPTLQVHELDIIDRVSSLCTVYIECVYILYHC